MSVLVFVVDGVLTFESYLEFSLLLPLSRLISKLGRHLPTASATWLERGSRGKRGCERWTGTLSFRKLIWEYCSPDWCYGDDHSLLERIVVVVSLLWFASVTACGSCISSIGCLNFKRPSITLEMHCIISARHACADRRTKCIAVLYPHSVPLSRWDLVEDLSTFFLSNDSCWWQIGDLIIRKICFNFGPPILIFAIISHCCFTLGLCAPGPFRRLAEPCVFLGSLF